MAEKPWVANKPEQRLAIAVDRFLTRALLDPCYFTAMRDDIGAGRSNQQRIRDANRGVKSGLLDWEIWQGDPLIVRRLELKRGKNVLSDGQEITVAALVRCGAPPIVAWDLNQVWLGLLGAGFRFAPNFATTLQHCEELLAAWDREAEAIKTGAVVKKTAMRKAPPRFTLSKRAAAGARKRGIMV